MDKNTQKRIKGLIQKNSLKDVFDLLRKHAPNEIFEHKLILLGGQHHSIEENLRRGIISTDEFHLKLVEIKKSLLELFEELLRWRKPTDDFDSNNLDVDIDVFTTSSEPLLDNVNKSGRVSRRSESATLENKKPIILPLEVTIDPGSAPQEVIEDILARLSILNKKIGGNGITFTLEDIFTDQTIHA